MGILSSLAALVETAANNNLGLIAIGAGIAILTGGFLGHPVGLFGGRDFARDVFAALGHHSLNGFIPQENHDAHHHQEGQELDDQIPQAVGEDFVDKITIGKRRIRGKEAKSIEQENIHWFDTRFH